jgi:CubicO group peptidase (beta-lactamase class C family)
MSPRRLILHLSLALVLAALPFAGATAQTDPLRGLDRYVERAMRAWQVPGVAIAVVHGDSVVYARGFGVRQLGGRDTVDAHTLFPVASTTKPMTAALLGMLVHEGRLDWDDPVIRHLPGFQLYDARASEELTLRDLLAHRSGLPRGDLLWWSSPYSREEVVRRARYLRPLWPIRTHFGYQNIMYIAAGEVAESVGGVTWDALIAERIFTPLGMSRSSTSVEAMLAAGNVAVLHTRRDGRVQPIPWKNFDNLGAAGAVNSTAWDMAQWIRLVLGEGAVGGRRLLPAAILTETQRPQISFQADSATERLFPEITARSYGLGWSVQEFRGRRMIAHDGSLDGVRAQIALIPEVRVGVVVIANLAPTNLHQAIAYHVLDAYLDAPRRDWSRDLLAAAQQRWEATDRRQRHRERARIVGTEPSLPLDRYAGTYIDSLYGEMNVDQVADGSLVLRFGHLWKGDLEHWHFNTFRVHWQDSSMGQSFLTFSLAPDGRVRMMSLEEFGDFGRASAAAGSATESVDAPDQRRSAAPIQ